MELEKVQELKAAIREEEMILDAFRIMQSKSPLMETSERRLENLHGELEKMKAQLSDEIKRRVKDRKAATVLLMRYVGTVKFSEIARAMSVTPEYVFMLHREGRKAFENTR